jgi:hypothetical protein
MSNEPEDGAEYRLAIPRDRLEDLIEQRAQAARRRKMMLRRLAAACLVAGGIGVASAMLAVRGTQPGQGYRASEVSAPAGEMPSAMTATTPSREPTTQPGQAATDSGVAGRDHDPSRAAAIRSESNRVGAESGSKLQGPGASGLRAESGGRVDPGPARVRPPGASKTKRPVTCERLEQELARCSESAAPASFGRRAAAPAAGAQAP